MTVTEAVLFVGLLLVAINFCIFRALVKILKELLWERRMMTRLTRPKRPIPVSPSEEEADGDPRELW